MHILRQTSMLCMAYLSQEEKKIVISMIIIIISIIIRVIIMLAKSRWVVRSGIRTHAYKSRLRPERSALDRSAILTCTWSKAKSLVRKGSDLAEL